MGMRIWIIGIGIGRDKDRDNGSVYSLDWTIQPLKYACGSAFVSQWERSVKTWYSSGSK